MSRAGRDADRASHDYYITPPREVAKFLHAFESYAPDVWRGPMLDPCAGGDTTYDATYPAVLRARYGDDLDLLTLDIRHDARADRRGVDFLTSPLPRADYRLIITNPPYIHALDFFRRAWQHTAAGGWVVFFLRLNFLGAQKRNAFWQEFPARWIFVHSHRPDFRPWRRRGGTDATEYAHFCWQKGAPHEPARVVVLPEDGAHALRAHDGRHAGVQGVSGSGGHGSGIV